MLRYEILLGTPVCRLFSNQYSDWVWALDTAFRVLGLDPEEVINGWTPREIDFTSFLRYITKIGTSNYPDQLYKFILKEDYDHYGKLWIRIDLELYSPSLYLKSENLDDFSRSILRRMKEEIKNLPGHRLLEDLRDEYKRKGTRFRDTQDN